MIFNGGAFGIRFDVIDVGSGIICSGYYMDAECTIPATSELIVAASSTSDGVILYRKLSEATSWASGTDEEIELMVYAAYRGEINLEDYWSVGDERTVHIEAMAATGVGESHVAQDVTVVLMDAQGLYTDVETGEPVKFVYGLKNGLANGTTAESGYMNSSNTNSNGWSGCNRRTWCDEVFYPALPEYLQRITKTVSVVSTKGSTTSSITSEDKCFLPAEKEVLGSYSNSNTAGEKNLVQWSYYKTASNRKKKCGDSGSAGDWYLRSPVSGSSTSFCGINSSGASSIKSASTACLIAPCGCF